MCYARILKQCFLVYPHNELASLLMAHLKAPLCLCISGRHTNCTQGPALFLSHNFLRSPSQFLQRPPCHIKLHLQFIFLFFSVFYIAVQFTDGGRAKSLTLIFINMVHVSKTWRIIDFTVTRGEVIHPKCHHAELG